jgi:hypothetical protein
MTVYLIVGEIHGRIGFGLVIMVQKNVYINTLHLSSFTLLLLTVYLFAPTFISSESARVAQSACVAESLMTSRSTTPFRTICRMASFTFSYSIWYTMIRTYS